MTSQRRGVLSLIALTMVVGCGAPPATIATTTPAVPFPTPSPSPHARSPRPSPASAALPSLSLLIEPEAGMSEIYALIGSARHSVDLTMYELEDTQAEAGLAADAERGVDVRVILNSTDTGSDNDAAFAYLKARKVHVHWASTR